MVVNNENGPVAVNTPLDIDSSVQIIPADTTIIDNNFVTQNFVLTKGEAKIINSIWDLVKNSSLPYPDDLKNPFDLIQEINLFCNYFTRKNNNTLNKGKSPVADKRELVDILCEMKLIEWDSEGNFVSPTQLSRDFIGSFNKIDKNFPFDWDFFTDPSFSEKKDLSKYLFQSKSRTNIVTNTKIGSKIYGLLVDHSLPDQNVVEKSMLFFNNNPETGALAIPTEKVKLLNSLSSDQPNDFEILKNFLSGIKTDQLEMKPISASHYYSVLQGTLNNQPIYGMVPNNIIYFCRNMYGKDLNLTFNYNDVLSKSNNKRDTSPICLNVFKDKTLVFTTYVDIQLPNIDRYIQIDRAFFNSNTVNMNLLRDN